MEGIDTTKLKNDFNLTYSTDSSKTQIDRVAQSEKACSTLVVKKGDRKEKPRTLDPSKNCKDDFTLTKKEDGKIYLARLYWSKIGIKPIESSKFCLLTYNATHKSAQICAKENREQDIKFKYVLSLRSLLYVLVLLYVLSRKFCLIFMHTYLLHNFNFFLLFHKY